MSLLVYVSVADTPLANLAAANLPESNEAGDTFGIRLYTLGTLNHTHNMSRIEGDDDTKLFLQGVAKQLGITIGFIEPTDDKRFADIEAAMAAAGFWMPPIYPETLDATDKGRLQSDLDGLLDEEVKAIKDLYDSHFSIVRA